MATTIMLPDGRSETVFDLADLLRLIEDRMGYETRDLLEEPGQRDHPAGGEGFQACVPAAAQASKRQDGAEHGAGADEVLLFRLLRHSD